MPQVNSSSWSYISLMVFFLILLLGVLIHFSNFLCFGSSRFLSPSSFCIIV